MFLNKNLKTKVARENFRKFSVFTGVFLKLFTPGFCFSRVKIGVFVHAHFHGWFFCRDCSRVTFRFTGAFLRIVHGWVVKVSRGKNKRCRKGGIFLRHNFLAWKY